MGLDEELSMKLKEIKRNVMKRYKHERYLELNEEMRRIDKKKERKQYLFINSEIKSLNYNSNTDGVDVMRLEEIECEVKNIIEKLEERERDLIDEDGESSMLCELNVMNLISFLKHFKVEINYSQFNNHNQSNNNNNNIGDNNFDNILKQKVYLLFIYLFI